MARAQAIDPSRDPFRERAGHALRWHVRVLGAPVQFTSNDRALLGLARDAFDGVPRHRWPGNSVRPGGARAARTALRIELERVRDHASGRAVPPQPVLSAGAGLLFGHVDAHSFVAIDPRAGRALVRVGDSLLRHPRLVRYELVEFAAITLASRAQQLVALHAGCVGARGRGVLLLGASGAGKSTLALHAALGGLEYVAEDSVFVRASTLHATGLGAYVHARADALELLSGGVRAAVRQAPRIQRRSGVRKHELDLRGRARLAPRPLRIVATVVLSARPAKRHPLRLLGSAQLRRALRAGQPYARGRPGWREFERRALRAGGFALGGMPPAQAAAALRRMLGVAA